MRRGKSIAILVCVGAGSLSFVPPATPQTVQSVAAAANRSICVVLAEGGSGTTSGTGFVIAGGFVLTANHVVQGAGRIRVLCPDHPATQVKLVNVDTDNDVALLQNTLLSIHPLPLGDSAKVQVGQEIVVIGFPRTDLLGLETATVVQGIVSSVRAAALQIQAPMGPGNSGSPVLTLQGQVIGVVRAVFGSQLGTNFATSFATAINRTSALSGLHGRVNVGGAPPTRQVSESAWRPAWTVGDTWAYEAPWGPTTFAVTRVVGSNVIMTQTVSNRGSGAIDVDATHLGKTTANWLPEVIWLDFPLTPGKSYSRVYNPHEQFSYHVGNMEQITVPAGSFSAIRVDVKFCTPQTDRCAGLLFWYAPAAKWFIRIVWDDSPNFNKDRRGKSMELLSVMLH